MLATYVTLDQGTGAVHTAPGHGADDYRTGVAYGLDIYAPVGPGGHFLETVETFGGLRVFDANPRIEAALAERGRLWHRSSLSHSYPHCWRCHHPVIFLATSQWFIAMDGEALRRARPGGDRPAWSGSRRGVRSASAGWSRIAPTGASRASGRGVCRFPPSTARPAVRRRSRRRSSSGRPPCSNSTARTPGTNARSRSSCLPASPARHAAARRSSASATSSTSGSTPARVTKRSCHTAPTWNGRRTSISRGRISTGAGSRARSWWASVTRGQAPYRAVVTHGFVVDKAGLKMSKSLGNTIEPQELIATERRGGPPAVGCDGRLPRGGADRPRDPRTGGRGLPQDPEHLPILLGNLDDFDPSTDLLPLDALHEVDRYTLARFAETARRVVAAFEAYDFPVFFQAINALVTVDLSAFYVDVTKDRLYTLAPAVAVTPRGADDDVPDCRRPRAPDGADSPGDGRRGVARASRARARSRSTWPTSRSSSPTSRTTSWWRGGRGC